ncbi:helix-turn-helix domain-containing protein [Lentisphaera marina]|uniref:helix-turn-helix domain-containing protein n=1 Tax=Lentisphaera marina TaxID=1111041 RepID=UPI00236686C5|nr:helix-turn-helix domain-containing protein [Lentisphaera marina]MDD7987368.1 helix-turn-helix domain-containing protein [Lentisphaera marina]
MNQRLFSPKEVAQALAVSEASIKRWVDKGLIKAEKTSGGHRKISLLSLQQYLKDNNKELVHPEVIDSGISAARKSGKLQEAKDLFYQALLSCDAKAIRAIPYDLFLAGMSLEMIFNEVFREAIEQWNQSHVNAELDDFQFKRSEQSLQGVLYFLGGLLALPDESAPYVLVGTLGDGNLSLAHMEEIILREQGFRTEFLGDNLNEDAYIRALSLLEPNKISLASNKLADKPQKLIDLCSSEKVEIKFF